jgi:hypothetical protein
MREVTMLVKKKSPYQVSLYLGSVNEETKEPFFIEDLYYEIGKLQDSRKKLIPVRVADTTFVCGTKYIEAGWEISAINYPKIPSSPREIDSLMEDLAVHLLKTFKQKTITTISPRKTIMYQRNEG